MRSRRIILVLGAALCALLLFLAVRSAHSKTNLEARVALATERREKIRRALHAAIELRSLNTKPPAPLPPSSKPDTPPAARRKPPGLMDLGRQNPQLLNYFIEAKKSDVARIYGPFWQKLNLSSEDQARFKEIITAAVARSVDIAAAADDLEVPRTNTTVDATHKASLKQRQDELAALLGAPKYRELVEYERTIAVRGFVHGFAAQLGGQAPLNTHQAEQLTQALALASASYHSGKRAMPAEIDWAVVDQQARMILTPAQFALWSQGVAHNPSGGSRRDLELTKIYEQAVRNTKAR
jgi:hypothetical protein